MRAEMLAFISGTHMVIKKCKNRAWEFVYFPELSKYTERIVKKCEMSFKKLNQMNYWSPMPKKAFQKLRIEVNVF